MERSDLKGTNTQQYPFLSGGEEMGALMRTKDWSLSKIGDPAGWPESLRLSISIILHSKFPMFIWWGPDLVCFYNDAYRPSLGSNGKHPSILGEPAKESWPEIWPIIHPLIDQVMKKGEAVWREDQLVPIFRNGGIEDVYWTFSYSPINDATGKPGGVLVTCVETTDKVLMLRKLGEHKEQLQFATDAAELATWHYDPQTDKFSGNERLKEWFGLPTEAELELSMAIAVIAEKDRARVTHAINAALDYQTRADYTIEYTIIHPHTKKEKTVLAKGKAFFNDQQQANRFSGTLQDVTEQLIAKKALQESERNMRLIILQAPVAIAIFRGPLYKVEIANPRALLLWGRDKKVIGRPILEAMPELTKQGIEALLESVYRTGQGFSASEFPVQIERNGELQISYVNFVYEALYHTDGSINGIMTVGVDVTEQVLARQKVEESEKRFRNVADSAPVLIWMAGTDKLCNFFNKAWLQFTGRGTEQENGDGWTAGIHPDDLQKCMDSYNNWFDKREQFYLEYRLRRHDGAYRWISVNGVPRFTTDGLFEGYIGACMDIHEMIIYQQNLKENEERLNIVIEASELGNWEFDVRTNEVHYSARYLEIFGYTKNEQPVHAQLVNQLYPEDRAGRDTAFEEAFKNGILYYEARIIRPDNTMRWIEVKGKVFFDNDQPTKLLGTIADVTAEKKYQQELFEREQKFRLLADTMPQMVWTSDAKGNLNYFNQSVFNYSGFSPEQFAPAQWLEIVHPDDKDANTRAWTNAVNAGKDFNFEHRFRRYDNTYRWQLSRASPQRDHYGNIQMWVGSSTDIQEIKELEEQKDYFISMASHELKTPITTIKGYVQLLHKMNQHSEDAVLRNSLTIIDKKIGTLTSLIGNLLDISKIKTGFLILDETPFLLNSLVKEIIEEVNHIYPRYKFVLSGEEKLPVVADRARISQVLINFLTNAVKYSPDSSEVKIHIHAKNGYAFVSVEDTGIGIHKNDQQKIFERFYRVEGKSEKTFPGFGIGLFISAEIIHKHKGEIGVESQPGKGSTFYFSLPLQQ